MDKELNIIILAGGLSEEREISLGSGKAIYDAIRRLGHSADIIDPTDCRSVLNVADEIENSSKDQIATSFNIAKLLNLYHKKNVDLYFLALHGGAGEDGTLQALFDLSGIKYTGSGLLASAAAMDKAFTKRVVANEGVPTPDWTLIKYDPNNIKEYKALIDSDYDLPVIIKPNNSGSTVGLTLVKKTDQIEKAITDAASVSEHILIEKYTKGREITASILDGMSFPLVEIIPSSELYDYHCKYTKGGSEYICPARIDPSLVTNIQSQAMIAYYALNCSGLARADFILDGNNIPQFLEINTLPGMTELSLAPMAAKEAGVDFDQLVEKVIFSAL